MFRYHNGNDEANGAIRGFGHTGFLCDDLDSACSYMEGKGVAFKKKPLEGTMRGIFETESKKDFSFFLLSFPFFSLFLLSSIRTALIVEIGYQRIMQFHTSRLQCICCFSLNLSPSGLAFAYDPDGYWVEFIQRGGISLVGESKALN